MTTNRLKTSSDPFYYKAQAFPQPPVYGYGSVSSAGVANPSIFKPLGKWTVTKGGTGDYTINHSIGATDYIVMLTAQDAAARIITLVSKSNTSFRVKTYTNLAVATDTAFDFIVFTNF